MKITTQIEVTLSAKAVYRDDKVTLTVDASIPYGDGRAAQGSSKEASSKVKKMFKEAFEALLSEQQDRAIKVAQAAQAESTMVAARMGEL